MSILGKVNLLWKLLNFLISLRVKYAKVKIPWDYIMVKPLSWYIPKNDAKHDVNSSEETTSSRQDYVERDHLSVNGDFNLRLN